MRNPRGNHEQQRACIMHIIKQKFPALSAPNLNAGLRSYSSRHTLGPKCLVGGEGQGCHKQGS